MRMDGWRVGGVLLFAGRLSRFLWEVAIQKPGRGVGKRKIGPETDSSDGGGGCLSAYVSTQRA